MKTTAIVQTVQEALGTDSLAVAVSGGVDSMVLLEILRPLRPLVLTVDHGLRPESADEVALVKQAAGDLQVRAHRLQLPAGPGLAARAREARLGWLRQHADRVALGHHRDDQAELVLDRLARGSGALGLSGMRADQPPWLRPLLHLGRAEIRAFAESRGLRWAEDPSNRVGTRGALRHEVLPALSRVRQGAPQALARSARLLGEDDRLLQQLAEALVAAEGVDLERWRSAPAPLRRRAVLELIRRTRGGAHDVAARHLDAIEASARVELSGGWCLEYDGGWLRCLPPAPAAVRLSEGAWGLWQIHSSAPVEVRPPERGERLGGRPLVERLRASGVTSGMRRFHPVVVAGARRWVPGVYLEEGPALGLSIVASCSGGPSNPSGGPYRATL